MAWRFPDGIIWAVRSNGKEVSWGSGLTAVMSLKPGSEPRSLAVLGTLALGTV